MKRIKRRCADGGKRNDETRGEYRLVCERANRLYSNDYLSAKGKSRGARKLASLRHSLLMPIGSDAVAWLLEFEGLPSALVGSGQEPSAGEVAVHAAMTLYAFHQQGQSRPMHIRGVRPWDWVVR